MAASGRSIGKGTLFAAVAMGLTLAGCVDDGDMSSTDAATTSMTTPGVESDSAGEATYGVPVTESDSDFWGTSTGYEVDTEADTDPDTDADVSTSGASSDTDAGTDTDADSGSSTGGAGTSSSSSG